MKYQLCSNDTLDLDKERNSCIGIGTSGHL